MTKQTIIGTGLSGLVGSKFVTDFSNQYDFISLSPSDVSHPVDITQPIQVIDAIEKSDESSFVVHLAAYTDVTGAWKQNGDTFGSAYQINVEGTKNIIKACQNTGKHLIHISTAYVFDGKKDDLYSEEDPTSPIEWYGETKTLAENSILEAENLSWTILRIDQPFRSDIAVRPDVIQRIISAIQSNSLYPQFTNHFFGPTYIDDFAKIIDWVIRTKTPGLFHASSGEKWSDYDFASSINDILKLDGTIKKGDLNDYLQSVNRPYQKNTAMNNSKLSSQLDFKLTSIKNAISQVTAQK